MVATAIPSGPSLQGGDKNRKLRDQAPASPRPESCAPDPAAPVHLVGIGGAGMSGIARLLLARGILVTGSDAKEDPVLDELRRLGARVTLGHRAENVSGAGRVVYTA